MYKGVAIVTILIGTAAAAIADGGDDPAVTVCEQLLQNDLPADARYQRVDATIEGSTVVLTFRKSVIAEPETGEATCVFQLDRSNAVYVMADLPDMAALEANCNEATEGSAAAVAQAEAQSYWSKRLDECIRMAQLAQFRLKRLLSIELYPIAADVTGLGRMTKRERAF